ncbi:MAG: tetratricopeptide repeat protein, partial [Armatimonadetes bacterium]|nr:tetratricopeptide repeat protein [Armatimonadota bacterium]
MNWPGRTLILALLAINGLLMLTAVKGGEAPPITTVVTPAQPPSATVASPMGPPALYPREDGTNLDLSVRPAWFQPDLKAKTSDPDYLKAVTAFNAGQFETALNSALAAVPRDPSNTHLRGLVAICYTRLGRYVEAELECRNTLLIDPASAETHVGLAFVLFVQRNFNGAIASYRSALRIDSKNFLARKNLGNILYHTGDVRGAMREMEQLHRIYPDHDYALFVLGRVYADEQNWDRAEEMYRGLLETQPIRPRLEIFFQLAEVLLRVHRYLDAEPVLREGLAR